MRLPRPGTLHARFQGLRRCHAIHAPQEPPSRTLRVQFDAGHRMRERFGHAWVGLTIVLALHVADEALTDFLSVYNPLVREARARLGWFPMPEFTFGVWLTGLCALVLLLLALSPFAYRGSRALRLVAYPYAAIMFLNGIGHLAASAYLDRWAPGATTAPLLLLASTWLVVAARAVEAHSADGGTTSTGTEP